MNLTGGPILHVSFNQDKSCFAVGTETGFFVCNSDPLRLRFSRKFHAGIGIVEMLFRCNILALVGGGSHPHHPPHFLLIWDDHQEKNIAELEFRNVIQAVKMKKNCIVVALERKIYLYDFVMRPIQQYDTMGVHLGLVSISTDESSMILAYPSSTQNSHESSSSITIGNFQSSNIPLITFSAVDSSLAVLVLNNDGSLLAVTSVRGTLIKVYDTSTGNVVKTFRRGTNSVTAKCLSFSRDSHLLASTSNHNTVHIFDLKTDPPSRWIGSSWISGEARSCLQIHVPETESICAFTGNENLSYILVILGGSGKYYKYLLTKENEWSYKQMNESEYLFDNAFNIDEK